MVVVTRGSLPVAHLFIAILMHRVPERWLVAMSGQPARDPATRRLALEPAQHALPDVRVAAHQPALGRERAPHSQRLARGRFRPRTRRVERAVDGARVATRGELRALP